jgi:hypothetical protein
MDGCPSHDQDDLSSCESGERGCLVSGEPGKFHSRLLNAQLIENHLIENVDRKDQKFKIPAPSLAIPEILGDESSD